MAFLLNSNQQFIIVDVNPRQGIFCQFYSQAGFSRPISIQPTANTNYSATLDTSNTLHIVSQNTKNQVTHFSYLNGHYTKRILLEDPTDSYKFSNLSLHYFNNALHLFYVACTPIGSSYTLLHQILETDTLETLLTFSFSNPSFRIFSASDGIYIVYLDTSNTFTLKGIYYSKKGIEHFNILSSHFPIKDFIPCLIGGTLHLVYEKETYGKYQLFYCNTATKKEQIIASSTTTLSPCIFSYLNGLWINYLEDGKLKTRLSMDGGNLFSTAITASIQENIARYQYFSLPDASFNTPYLYASNTNLLRIAVVSSMDIEGIHPDIKPNIELDLLLEGMSLLIVESSSLKPEVTTAENTTTNEVDSNSPTTETKAKPSIKSAASAFMEQLNSWDLPPNT